MGNAEPQLRELNLELRQGSSSGQFELRNVQVLSQALLNHFRCGVNAGAEKVIMSYCHFLALFLHCHLRRN